MSFFVFSRDTPQNVQLIRWSGLCELIAGFLGSIVVQLSESMVNSWLVGLPEKCPISTFPVSAFTRTLSEIARVKSIGGTT
jgi:hypothetical protein